MGVEVSAEVIVIVSIFRESKERLFGPMSNIKNLHSVYKHL